ncbi:MAG: triple tyrosine motif-containing protein [Cyclobacteriaceae bacterium]
MRTKILVVLFLITSGSFAQTGNSFLSHYAPTDERIDYRSMGMVQDDRGLIYFTNKKGVLEFDGKNWQLIPTPGAVYTLTLHRNEVFVGGVFGFGKLTQNGNHRAYQSISTSPNIFSSAVASDKVLFCNENKLFVLAADKIEKEVAADASDNFAGLLQIHEKVFLKSFDQDLLQWTGEKLQKSVAVLPTESEIIFSSAYEKTGDAILGTEAGKVYILKGTAQPIELKLSDEGYLRQNKLVNGVWVSEKLIALGTLRGGVLLINPIMGATEEIIDYSSGLRDNEIFALLGDHNEGVWVAHEYGFTRIAPSVPFRSFNHYTGLAGNLLCTHAINGQVYVGTTLGLYLLNRETSVQKIVVQVQQSQRNQQENKRTLFGFLRKKKKEPATSIQPKTTVENKIIKPLGYAYRRVEGIDGKVVQLIEVNGKLIAAGLGGVYEVEGLKAKSILAGPVRSVFFSTALQQLLVGTYQEEVKSFFKNAQAWKETHLLDTLNDYVNYSFEDNLQNIWLCGRAQVHKIETVDGQISNVESLPVDNASLDEMVGVAYGNEVYLAASDEFRKFDRKSSFVKYDSLPGPHRYFASAGYFWFNDGNQWRTVDSRLKNLKLQWLGLFPNLRFLAPDADAQGMWVITADNELYKFSNSAMLSEDQRYPLLLREVRGQEISLDQGKGVTMDQPENTLSFEFIQPDYVSRQAMQYRYQVKGLTNGWTVWSSANYVANFPYLPPGTYQLAMQSRDLLGNESKVEMIPFEVLPPYWKRWWFYALEFAFFGVLMFLSVKLSDTNSKYRYVSQILSLLTVIIFIQFVSTAITSLIEVKSSPVIQFIIQVFIALLVFPLELYFRKFMQGAVEGKFQIKGKGKSTTTETNQ